MTVKELSQLYYLLRTAFTEPKNADLLNSVSPVRMRSKGGASL